MNLFDKGVYSVSFKTSTISDMKPFQFAFALVAISIGTLSQAQVETIEIAGKQFSSSNVVELGAKLDSIDSAISNLSTDGSGVADSLAAHRTDIGTLNSGVSAASDSIAAHRNEIEGMASDLVQVQSTIFLNQSDVVAIGKVNSDGTLDDGQGFTCTRNSTGNYTITFDTAMDDDLYHLSIQPLGTNNDTNVHITSLLASECTFWLGDADNGGGADVATNKSFLVMVVDW